MVARVLFGFCCLGVGLGLVGCWMAIGEGRWDLVAVNCVSITVAGVCAWVNWRQC